MQILLGRAWLLHAYVGRFDKPGESGEGPKREFAQGLSEGQQFGVSTESLNRELPPKASPYLNTGTCED